MRHILVKFPGAVVLTVSLGAANVLCAQEKADVSRGLPVQKEIHRQYRLAPNTAVAMSMIAGPVDIDTTTDHSAEVYIVTSAATQADLDCSDMLIEQTPGQLVIRSRDLCPVVKATQRVMLTLPRNANLDLEYIAGHVRIGPTEGMVRLESIAGHVTTGALQAAEMSSLAEGLSMELDEIGERGVHLSSVVGGIELRLSNNLNAAFVADTVVGNVTSDIPTVKIVTIVTDGRSDYEARIGSGGPRITISSVRGGVRLRKLS